MSSGVQTATVSADEAGMRVDRFVEARFPGLAFSHIQRIIRKGELRVNGKRAQPKQRLEAGQAVRLPPLRSEPRPPAREAGPGAQTRDFLKSITLYEDADVLVLDKPMGLAVQGGSGTTRHLDAMLETLRDARGQRPRLVHRLDKNTAGCLLVAKTRFAAAALAKTFRSRSARKIYWALVARVPKPRQGRISTFLAKETRGDDSFMRVARHGEEGATHAVTYYAVIDTGASISVAFAQAGDRPHPPVARAPGAYWPSHRGRSEIFFEGELGAAAGHSGPTASFGAPYCRAASARRHNRCDRTSAAPHAPVMESHWLRS